MMCWAWTLLGMTIEYALKEIVRWPKLLISTENGQLKMSFDFDVFIEVQVACHKVLNSIVPMNKVLLDSWKCIR
jgi:hypothetical protein